MVFPPRVESNEELLIEIAESLEKPDVPRRETLCVICHLSSPTPKLSDQLIKHLNPNYPNDIQIFVLEAIQKHILDSRMLTGDRLSSNFLTTFNEYLQKAPKKTMHFIIGIIENSGSQGIYFRKTLQSIKWSIFDAFRSENRSSITRIDELEKRWQKLSN